MHISRRFPPAALLCAFASFASAQTPAPIPPADQSAFLKPYMNESTFFIVRADVGLIDSPALQKFITDLLAPLAAKDPTVSDGLSTNLLFVDGFLAKFKQLGGRQIYAVFNLDASSQPNPPIIFFPFDGPANAKPLTDLLATLPLLPRAVSVNDHLLAIDLADFSPFPDTAPATQSALPEKLQAITPAPRPDIDQALAAGSGAIQYIIAPGKAFRKMAADQTPNLAPEFGGGSANILIQHARYGIISIAPPPDFKFTATVQTDSPENAKAVAALLPYVFKQITDNGGPKLDYAALFPVAFDGSSASISVDEPTLQKVFTASVPAFIAAREQAKQTVSTANLHTITINCEMYAAQHDDAWPPDLKTLVSQGLITDSDTLLNPRDPKKRPYIYHAWSVDEIHKLSAADAPAVWEDTDDDASPIVVGYLDGHVDTVPDKKTLTKQLEAAKAAAKNP